MKKLFLTTGLIVLICFLSLCLFKFYLKPQPNKSPGKAASKLPENSVTYIVKDFNGNVAVFSKNVMDHPFRVTNVYTKSLPAKDRAMLESGVEAENEGELNELLEDLGS